MVRGLSRQNGLQSLALVGGGVLLALAAVGPIESRLRVGLLFLLCVPAVMVLSIRRPVLAAGLLVAAEPLDALELQTPIASVSLRSLLLISLVLFQWRTFRETMRSRPELRPLLAILIVWCAASLLRATHSPIESVLRAEVTSASFAGLAVIGIVLAEMPGVLRAVGAGATIGLTGLGGVGVLASLGYIPLPQRTQVDRLLLGIHSPFLRNYGLNVPYDAIALMVPICVPLLILLSLRKDTKLSSRLAALLGLAAVSITVLLVFQSRGMLLQIGLALVLALGILWRRLRYVSLGLGFLLLAYTGIQLLISDPISSGIRLGTDQAAISGIVSSPKNLLFGTDAAALFDAGVSEAGYSAALPPGGGAVVHNAFLQNLASGGLALFIPFLLIQMTMMVRSFRFWRSDQMLLKGQVLLIASTLVVFELNVEPAIANVVGSWLILGLCWGQPYAKTGRIVSQPGASLAPIWHGQAGTTEAMAHSAEATALPRVITSSDWSRHRGAVGR